MRLDDFKRIAEDYKNSLNLLDWGIVFTNAKRIHGQCRYNFKELAFSRFYIENNTQEKILNTLMHECAHALTPLKGHGREWKLKCLELGMKNPARCSSDTVMPKCKYQAECENCGVLEIFRHRLTDSAKNRTIHAKCGKGKISWTTQLGEI